MEPKYLNFGNRSVPSYLGYGILNEMSVALKDDVVYADYHLECDGSIVHKVIWDRKICRFITLHKGIEFGYSQYPSLSASMVSEFRFIDFTTNAVFLHLMKAITRLGNIYVQFPGSSKDKHRLVFSPAGLLMCFRLPVLPGSDEYERFLEKTGNYDYIKLHKERRAYLITADDSGKVEMLQLMVAEFVSPLAYMTAAARLFTESGIIDSRMPLRLMIAEISQAETTSVQFFNGNKSWPCFGFCYADLTDDEKQGFIEAFQRIARS